MYHDSWTRKEIYSIDGSTVDGPIVKQFKKSASVTCSASLSSGKKEKTFIIIPKSEFISELFNFEWSQISSPWSWSTLI